VAVVYGLCISLFLYKDITWRDLPPIILKAFQTSAVVLLVIGATGCLAWLITVEQVAMQLSEWVQSVAHEPWVFLLLLNVCLLLLGIFIEPLPAMLLTTPLFLPWRWPSRSTSCTSGRDHCQSRHRPLHAACRRHPFCRGKHCEAGIGPVSRHLIPLMAAAVVVLFIITYVPQLTQVIFRLVIG